MGKAQRARLKRAEDQERADRLRQQKKAERRDTMKITVIAVSILLVIAMIVAAICIAVNAVRSTGNYLRNKVGISSEHYEINNAMMSYFFRDTINSTVQNALATYGSYATYYGMIPDTTKALRDQKNSSGTTWYDYFMNSAAKSMSSMLVLTEAARADGVELTDVETDRIDKMFEKFKKQAEEQKMSFEDLLHESYGLGVKESDVRDALELYYLSQKYYNYRYNGIEITDDEIKEYYDKNADKYNVVDYKVHTFTSTKAETKASDADSALKRGRRLAEAKTSEEFDTILRELIKDDYEDKDKLDEAVENALYENATLVAKSEYSEWLFNEKTEVGDTKIVTADNGNVSVYMLIEKSHLNEDATKDVRHILFSLNDYESDADCKAAAEEILAKYKEEGGGEEVFAELAKRYSSDPGSYALGGLYMDVSEGEMVDEFNDWLFDKDRKTGDCDIVKTSYGYHIMYYVGEGRPVWKANVFETLRSDEYSDIVEELTKTYTVTVDIKKLGNIPDIH